MPIVFFYTYFILPSKEYITNTLLFREVEVSLGKDNIRNI